MMEKIVVFAIGVILMASVGVAAQSPVRVHKSALSRTAIPAGDLKLTITDISNGNFGGGPYSIEVEVENVATTATPFDPQRLSFVMSDSHQIDVSAVKLFPGKDQVAPRELLLISGARSKQSYWTNGKLQLPARLYYQGNLVAELTE
jgi:hypothetical protein